MFLEVNRQENRIIKEIREMSEPLNAVQCGSNLKDRKKLKPWQWFIILWFAGFFGTLVLAYGTKGLFWICRMMFNS